MWENQMRSWKKMVAPGAGWGGVDFVNPGYFAPAWYRLFREVDTNHDHDWNKVIDNCYTTLLHNVGYENGLVPDWTTVDGQFYDGGSLGYNAYGDGKYMYKDGIRVLWRIGTDFLWYRDLRAEQFLLKSYEFIKGKGGATASNFYQMDGQLIPSDDIWIFDEGRRERHRQEHSPLTIGMWSIVPYVLGADDVKDYETELLSYYEPNSTYWGITRSINNQEDISHNEMYFDQFLAWFGGIVLHNKWRRPF